MNKLELMGYILIYLIIFLIVYKLIIINSIDLVNFKKVLSDIGKRINLKFKK